MNPESQYGWVLDSPTHLEERVSSPESARNDHVRIDLITTSHPPPPFILSPGRRRSSSEVIIDR